jgi:hypothetical protein
MVLRLYYLRVLLCSSVEAVSTSFIVVGRRMTVWGVVHLHWRIKVAVLGFQLAPRSAGCLPPLIWLCQQNSLGDSCPEIAVTGGIQSCVPMFFLWPSDFRGSTSKLRWLLISWSTLPRSMVLAENVMAAGIWGLAIVGRVLVTIRNWLSDLWLGSVECKWERLHTRSLQSSFQDENRRSDLNLLCPTMILLKALFLRARTFFRVKT